MISFAPFIYFTAMALAPYVFINVNHHYKWITKEDVQKEGMVLFGLCILFIAWPLGLLIMLYAILHRHFPNFLPSNPPENHRDRYGNRY
jgi:hypothetical protein